MGKIPADYVERCYAGWLGKVIGVRHGAPIEGWSYEKIEKLLGEITDYPVAYRDFAADDDSNGPLFFLRALSDYTHTRDITAEQIGKTWLNYAPYEHGFYWWGGYGRSTEHTAYLNLRAGIMAPRSGSVEQNGAAVAEQIGGQIFIDSWGLTIPADPELAAEYAGKAASVGHGGNGVYGGQFVAAAISAAFVQRDVRAVIESALGVIPAGCEYARMARDIIRFYDDRANDDWRMCMEYIIANWGYDRYPGVCHIIPNSAVIVMSLLYGAGSFDRAINICNMAGWDTDCNVANVGSIMGVLTGLSGIDEARWRQPINDFLVASSVVGCMNIMNLPDCVRLMANLAYKIAGEAPPERWQAFLMADSEFDFMLPGSTCAFRTRGGRNAKEDVVYHEDKVYKSGGSLRVLLKNLQPGDERYVYYGTYYRPHHFHDSRYDPSFSPVLYPGQTVTASVSAGSNGALKAALYALDGNTGHEYVGKWTELKSGEWADLSLDIPPLCGAVIEQAGVKLMALRWEGQDAVYIDRMHFAGKADYTVDFSKERMEVWTPLHREVSQMTYLKGIWDLQDGRLMGTCADFGEAYTGDIHWRDVEVTCKWRSSALTGMTGFAFRVQGAIRGYALFLDGDELLFMKNDNGYRELGRCAFKQGDGDVELAVRCIGNRFDVLCDNTVLMAVEDASDPYLSGMVGLALRHGGHACYASLKIKAL